MRARPRVGGRALAVLPAVVAAATLPVGGAGADTLLERGSRAATEVPFVGAVTVSWRDGAETWSETLLVQGGSGSVVVTGGTTVAMSAQTELVVRHGDEWDRLWPSGVTTADRPALSAKYRVVTVGSAEMGGRAAEVVDIYEGDERRERLHLDEATGLLLGREQFDPDGTTARRVEFETITVGSAAGGPPPPGPVHGDGARTLAPDDLGSAHPAPAGLAGGFRRVGVYEHDGVVQVLYGDGLYDLSVFQQRGRLDRAGLPGEGRPVRVGGTTGWHYVWPGGHLVAWGTGRVVFVAVSDAPLDQVVRAVGSLPAGEASASFLQRLRRVCRSLVLPLGR